MANIDLSISKTDSVDPILAGGTITYTLAVSNSGAATTDDVTVTDNLPSGFTFISASSSGGSFTNPASAPGGTATFTGGALGAGGNATLTIVATAPTTGTFPRTIDNTATITAGGGDTDIDLSDNSATESTTLNANADLAISKTASAATVNAGGTVTFTLAVSNAANGVAVSGITVEDVLPSDFTFVSASGSGFSIPSSAVGNQVTFTNGSLPAGGSAALTIVATAPTTGTFPRTVTNTAEVDPSNVIAETNETNNSSSTNFTVVAGNDLSITKTASANTIPAGGTLTYTLNVTNAAGGTTVNNISVEDVLPSGFNFISASTSSGTGFSSPTSVSNGRVTFTGGTLTAGSSATLTILGTVPASTTSQTITNSATVDPSNLISESNESNNTATLTTTIGAAFTVTVTRPTANSTSSGSPSGVQPTNAADDGFFNLTDNSDSVSLASFSTNGLRVRGLSGNDNIQGTTAADNINGNQGADTINGGSGSDTLYGGQGSDFLEGSDGNDVINGNKDNDTVNGGNGDDTLRGGQGNDLLNGNAGNDVLIGDLGQDILAGGTGADIFVLRAGAAVASSLNVADLITDFSISGNDRIGLTDSTQFGSLVFESVSLSFDGNTSLSTAIRLGATGSYLGIVRGMSPSDFNSSLFTNADSFLSIG